LELIQEFEMPGVSTTIKCSPDNQYILVTGTYKPRVRCFDLNNLSMKFERCFDSEVECFDILSDDYTKIVLLQTDRYLEIHSSSGRHYRLRIPKPGRDLKYQHSTCDLLVVGTSSEIYRLNLERGQFLQPFETSCSILNTVDVNPYHNLICAGSQDGIVEAWDPRDRKKASSLDVAMHLKDFKNFPSVTNLKFKNELQMAVGTSTGHVFMYDIRSREPTLIKDHLNQLPIKRIFFSTNENYVYSLDSAMVSRN
jgi:ribosome biogenesis protein ENP2